MAKFYIVMFILGSCLAHYGLCALDQTQVEALKSLGTALNMPEYANATLTTACRLRGVTCSVSLPRVLGSLDLRGFGLSGTLPPSIGNLIDLKNLDLGQNSITGTVPSTIGSILGLTLLRLDNNSFTGELPDLSALTNLTIFRADFNYFNGSLPAWLGNLTSLTILTLGSNNFEGDLPVSITSLKSLTSLQIDDNQLSGTLPSLIGDLSAIEELSLKGSRFTGPIPSSIENLKNLTTLKLSDNLLNGTIPSFAGNTNLQNLILSNNRFTGTIPAFVQSRMFWLILDGNQLTGTIPKLPNSMTLLQFQNNVGLSGCFNQNFTVLLGCSIYNTSLCCAPDRCKGEVSKCVVTDEIQIEGELVVTSIEFSENSTVILSSGAVVYINGSECPDFTGDLVVEVDFATMNASEYDLMTYACYSGEFNSVNLVYENQGDCDSAKVVYQNTKLTLLVASADTCQNQQNQPLGIPDYAIALIICLPIVVAAAIVIPIMILRHNKRKTETGKIQSRVAQATRSLSH